MGRDLPKDIGVAVWAVRVGLVVAAAGIVGFLASLSRVTGPVVAAADLHSPPWAAWVSIFAWSAGVLAVLAARRYIRVSGRRTALAGAPDEEGES